MRHGDKRRRYVIGYVTTARPNGHVPLIHNDKTAFKVVISYAAGIFHIAKQYFIKAARCFYFIFSVCQKPSLPYSHVDFHRNGHGNGVFHFELKDLRHLF